MRPVAVKEILTYGERLGITEVVDPPGACRSVRHVLRCAGGESGNGMTPFPQSILILPPTAADGGFDNGWNRCVSAATFRNISCLALSVQGISGFLRQFSERTGTPIFASRYDDSLLHSRLAGLLREKGERQVMVHGVLVRVSGLGVLLLGESGIGKTACGLALMVPGNRWVADDAVVLEERGEALYGRGHERTGDRIAVRGRGILRAEELLGTGRLLKETRVDVIIRLVRFSGKSTSPKDDSFQEIVGVYLPCRDLSADVDPRRMAERVTGCVRSFPVV